MNKNLLFVLALCVASLTLLACGGARAAADCMEAMATVNCPPRTRPEAASEGSDSFTGSADVRRYQAEATAGSSAGCDYVCIPYCECGISRIGGDGSVECVPCD